MRKITILAFLMLGFGCADTPPALVEPIKPLRFVVVHTQDIAGYMRIKLLLDTQTGDCYLATDGRWHMSDTKTVIRISSDSCQRR